MSLLTRTTFVGTALLALGTLTTLTAQTSGNRGAAASGSACALFSSTEVATVTGRQELANARQIPGTGDEGPLIVPGSSTDCGFMGSSLNVALERVTSIDGFDAAAKRRVDAGEFQPYAGLGDAAWFRYNKYLKQHGFVVRVGSHVVTIMIDTSEAGSTDKAKSQLLPIAQTAVTKLR